MTVPNSSSYSSQIQQQQQQEQGQPQQGQPVQAQPQQVHLNVPDPTKSQTILFPAHSQHNQIRFVLYTEIAISTVNWYPKFYKRDLLFVSKQTFIKS